MNTAIIALGSNIEPQKNIAMAKNLISENFKVLAESRFVETAPIGITDQPNFLNGAMLIQTVMEQRELKRWLRGAETKLGRVRGEKYGPRTIDLDIVVWNGVIVDLDVYERDFLQQAIAEVLSIDVMNIQKRDE